MVGPIEHLLGMLLLGQAVWVLVYYARQQVAGQGGALTRHVAAIALSYCLLIADELFEAAHVFEGPDLELVAYVLGIVALTILLRELARRRR